MKLYIYTNYILEKPLFNMSKSYNFIGWIEDDAIKVVKTHLGNIFGALNFESNDLTIMVQNVQEIKTKLKKTQFKGMSFRIICDSTEPMYVLYMGHMSEHACSAGKSSIHEIPTTGVNNLLTYINLIKEKKIKKTKFPQMYNIVESCHVAETRKSREPVDINLDDQTEDLEKLVKPRTSKNGGNSGNVKYRKGNPDDSEETEEDNIETPERPNRGIKQVHFTKTENINGDDYENDDINPPEENQDDIEDLDDESPVLPDEPPAQETTEPAPPKQTPPPPKSQNPPESQNKGSRRDRRKAVIDDAEESQWESLK